MNKTLRFDTAVIKATRNDDGFIYDSPIVTRTGVFPYRNPDGSIRYELRLPEEVFSQDSLDTLRGIPITNGHVGKANSKNTRGNIGAVLGNARQDNDNLIADIVIHNPSIVDAGNKELSCGYECELEETSGIFNGQRYDCIQRNIRYNHLAVVGKGRAGNARLNLDAADAAFFEPEVKENDMVKLRLDNGIEYDVVPEVVAAFNKIRQDLDDTKAAKDKADAEKDNALAELQKLQEAQPEIVKAALAEAKKRIALEAKAKEQGVDVKQDAADRDIKIAVIQKIRQDGADLSDKSDAYIDAAFDIALADNVNMKAKQDAAKQRADASDGAGNQALGSVSAAQAREQMINGK